MLIRRRNYVLIAGLIALGLAPRAAQAFPITDGAEGNFLLGQNDWADGFVDPALDPFFGARPVSATSMFAPSDVAFDSMNNVIAVADRLNRRVLLFSASPGTTFTAAPFLVLGQPDMVTGGANPAAPFGASNTQNPANGCITTINACGVRRPFALAFDSARRHLFVTDPDNHRILVYDLSGPTSNGMAARWVLGQSSMETAELDQPCGTTGVGTPNQCGLNFPESVAYDATSNQLYVADSGNHRVISYDVSTLANGMAAHMALGQSDLTSIAVNGGCAGGAPGTVNACGMKNPTGVAVDSQRGALYVADGGNHRVLRFALAGLTTGAAANLVLGQPDFTTATANTACGGGISGETNINPCGFGIYGLKLAVAGTRLFVTDTANHRIIEFDQTSLVTGMAATAVLGEANMNSGFDPAIMTFGGGTSRRELIFPEGIVFDPGGDRLFVADVGNHRIVVFGANLGGKAVETRGDVVSMETTANADGSTTVGFENVTGNALDVTLPEGTQGQNGGGVELLIGYVNGNPDFPGILIVADLPPGETKSVTLPVLTNRLCIIDRDTAIIAAFSSCPRGLRVRVPNAGTCRNRTVYGELGDNPNNPTDPNGRHRVEVCTAADGASVTVNGLLHTYVATAAGEHESDWDPDSDAPTTDDENVGNLNGGCSITSPTSSGLSFLFVLMGVVLGLRRRWRHHD